MHIGKIPGRSTMYLLICLVILAIFYFVAVYPYQRSMDIMDVETAQAVNRIEKQKVLLSLYEKMVKLRKGEVREVLSLPDKKRLARNDIDAIAPLFEKIADECKMKVVSVSPDALALTEKSSDIMVNIHLKGNFFDFRKFLVELGGMPFLDRVEEIEIKQETVYKQFYLKVRLAIG
ncbi:MAG: hypothetical protein U9R20_00910 [Thermodesulfobacteriota bacterium]|nr:hypothetical protein [Thermodesulfobacteriota bacterium]